jgi:hypothetical protein
VPARGAAPRLLRVARGTSPTRARPAHGHAPGHGAPARGGRSRIASLRFSTTIFSHCRPVPTAHTVMSLYTTLFRRTVGLCPHCRTSLLSTTSSGTRLPVAVTLLRQLWNFCFMACCSATLRNHHALELRLPLLFCVA